MRIRRAIDPLPEQAGESIPIYPSHREDAVAKRDPEMVSN
jgi:hypothetical protein